MARLRTASDAELTASRRATLQAAEAAGHDTTQQRVLALRQDMMDSYFAFYRDAHEKGMVEPELKELVRLKIARLNDCFT